MRPGRVYCANGECEPLKECSCVQAVFVDSIIPEIPHRSYRIYQLIIASGLVGLTLSAECIALRIFLLLLFISFNLRIGIDAILFFIV